MAPPSKTGNENTMAKQTEVNYTEAQENRIREMAPMNAEKAEILAKEFGKKAASVRAKAIRMNVPYEKKGPQTKTGEAVIRKETLVSKIAAFTAPNANLDGLEKASKPALQAVLAALEAN